MDQVTGGPRNQSQPRRPRLPRTRVPRRHRNHQDTGTFVSANKVEGLRLVVPRHGPRKEPPRPRRDVLELRQQNVRSKAQARNRPRLRTQRPLHVYVRYWRAGAASMTASVVLAAICGQPARFRQAIIQVPIDPASQRSSAPASERTEVHDPLVAAFSLSALLPSTVHPRPR
jgi:hypothetical protein